MLFGVWDRCGTGDTWDCTAKAWAIGLSDPFFNTKHVRSGLLVAGDDDVLQMTKKIIFRFVPWFHIKCSTYNGPGRKEAPLIREYGIMTIGLVGNAKYGGGITGGLLASSGGLWDPLLDAFDFGAGVVAAVLLNGRD